MDQLKSQSKSVNWKEIFPLRRIIFLAAGLVLAVALFIFTKNFTTCWQITSLPGVAPKSCQVSDTPPVDEAPQVNPEGTPVAVETVAPTVEAPAVELPPPWDGASRVTMLIIGLDFRDWETSVDAPRSDTMIVLTIDPVTMTAGMLSIPRDLWVNIPGFGYSRINNAYSLGESYKLPGGGPGLAMKTVENLLGVPIKYFAQIDFQAFERFIDEIWGVQVTPQVAVELDPIGEGYDHVFLEAGVTYTLPGNLALAYARNRSTGDGDIDRAERQQEVILGIRNRLLDPQYFLPIVGNANALYQELSSGIHTNLSLDDALQLGVLAREIDLENIKRGVITYEMVTLHTITLNGAAADVLKPIPDKIRVLRDEIFGTGSAVNPMATGSATELMLAEGARVQVLNGTYSEGLAGETQAYLISQGMNIVSTENGEWTARTIVIDYTGKPYTLKYLSELMNLTSYSQFRNAYDPASSVDVVVILGDDWAYSNPMP